MVKKFSLWERDMDQGWTYKQGFWYFLTDCKFIIMIVVCDASSSSVVREWYVSWRRLTCHYYCPFPDLSRMFAEMMSGYDVFGKHVKDNIDDHRRRDKDKLAIATCNESFMLATSPCIRGTISHSCHKFAPHRIFYVFAQHKINLEHGIIRSN